VECPAIYHRVSIDCCGNMRDSHSTTAEIMELVH
jgi:hypothetical protein